MGNGANDQLCNVLERTMCIPHFKVFDMLYIFMYLLIYLMILSKPLLEIRDRMAGSCNILAYL